MNVNLPRVSSRLVEDLRAHPERITKVLHPDLKTETVIDEDVKLDLGTRWHALHAVLGGTPPLDFLVAGAPIGDVDVGGHGPARGFTNDEVARIANALAPMSVAAVTDQGPEIGEWFQDLKE